ncbi:MAG TPA: SDR family NAD(P)-dependent oxidoreductase [Stellaceae bacterium]|nr:SDR family NAD(P)-dependent oxidoreductase [Stellaceae bacterium]
MPDPASRRRFEGRTAVITGGYSGIGAATAACLAAEGAEVWVLDVAAPRVAIEDRQIAVDVGDFAAVSAAATAILERTGRIDVLVTCAAIVRSGTAYDQDAADWRDVLRINLDGAFNAMRAMLPAMIARRSGAVVHVASDAGLIGQRDQIAYATSKGGVVEMTRSAALDAAPFGVRVNAVCPCFVDTPMMRRWIDAQPDPGAALAEAAAEQLLGRIGRPAEIAAAIAFLASDDAAFITGVNLPVDGGSTAG